MREINIHTARRLLEIVDCGLTNGLGVAEPGKMCVEAAVCYALDLPHGDEPPCVDYAVRAFKVRLNDSPWSSDAARASGMRRVAVAQLGSAGVIDSVKFARIIAEQTIRRIVPKALRAAASMPSNKAHRDRLLAAAERCVQDGDYRAADAAADAAAAAAAAAARAAAAAAAAAARAAADAADAAADAADAAAAAAAAARAAADAAGDEILRESADICLFALRECGSPGVALLDQIEAEAA